MTKITAQTVNEYDENASPGSSVGTNRKAITVPDTFDEWRQFTNLLSEDHEDLAQVVEIVNSNTAHRQGDGHYSGAANSSTFFDNTADTSVSITTVSTTSGTGLTQFFVKSEKAAQPRSRITIGQEIDDSDAILEFKAHSDVDGGGIVYSSASTSTDYYSSAVKDAVNFYRINSGARHNVFSYPHSNGTVTFVVAPKHNESLTFDNTSTSTEMVTMKYVADGFADINNFVNVDTTGLASTDILKYNGSSFVPVNDRDSITKIAVNSGTAIVGATDDTSNTAETIKLSGTSSDLVEFVQGNTANNVTPVTVKLNLAQAAVNDNGVLPKANYQFDQINLGDLKNVTVNTPADNEVVAYDSTTSQFINQTLSEAGIASAGHDHDSLYVQLANNDVDKDGSQAINGKLVIDNGDNTIGGTTITNGALELRGLAGGVMGIDSNEIMTNGADLFLYSTTNDGTNGLKFNGSIVWNAGNDGTGSGLDADLLDGQEGAYYAPINNAALTGVPTAPTAPVGTNTTQIATTEFIVNELQSNATYSGININADGDTLEPVANGDTILFKDSTYSNASMSAKTSLGGSPEQFAHNITITPIGLQSRGAFTTAATGNPTNATDNRGTGLFHYYVTGSGTSELPDTNNFNILNFGGEAANSFNYQANIALSGDGMKMYLRTNQTGDYGSWRKIWTENNDGAGSGLNADLLDGNEATAFATSGHNHDGTYLRLTESTTRALSGGTLIKDTNTGSHPFVISRLGNYIASPDPTTDQPQHTGIWQDDAGLNMHIENDETGAQLKLMFNAYDTERATLKGTDASSGNILLRNNNANGTEILIDSTNKVWHAGNDGTGSGLDADLLDGIEATGFALASHNHDTQYAAIGAEANQNAFTTIAVSGQDNVVADATEDTLTLVAGDSISITTTQGSDSVTISHSDTSSQSTVSNTGRNVIQGVELDAQGHVTSLTSTNLDTEFIQKSSSQTGGNSNNEQQTIGTNLTVERQLRIGKADDETDSLIRFYNTTGSPGNYNQIIGYDPSTSSFYISNDNGTNKNKIWHAGNDGDASGLDADKLDGVHSTGFSRGRQQIQGGTNGQDINDLESSFANASISRPLYYVQSGKTAKGWPDNADFSLLNIPGQTSGVDSTKRFTQIAGEWGSDKIYYRNYRSTDKSWYEMWTKANLSYPVQGYTGPTSTTSSGIQSIRTVTQAQYDGLVSKDSNTLYLIPTA